MNNKKQLIRDLIIDEFLNGKPDYEEVDENIYYSRAVRTICVLDSTFEEELDEIVDYALADILSSERLNTVDYETAYGTVRVYFKNTGYNEYFDVCFPREVSDIKEDE